MPASRTSAANSSTEIHRFRSGDKAWRPEIPTGEKRVVAVAALLLIFAGWGLGGMRIWSQVTLGGLSLLCFILCLVPDPQAVRRSDNPLSRLLKSPIFWLGGTYIAYLLTQALNPSWMYVLEGTKWWLQRLPHIGWLPSGMITPFTDMSPWRCLIWMGGAWLFVCALVVGIQHRRSAVFLLWVTVLNTAVMTFVGILAKLSGTRELLWTFDKRGAVSFFGSFYYANHAGAWILAHLGICLGLALYSWIQAQRRGKRSNPAFFFLMIAALLYAGLLFTASRGSLLIATSLITLAIPTVFIALFQAGTFQRGALVGAGILLLLITGYSAYLFSQVDLERINRDIQRAFADVIGVIEDPDPQSRENLDGRTRWLFVLATRDMWQERPVTGFGIGSYRFYIPVHQRNYPEIYIHPYSNRSAKWKERRGFPTDTVLTRKLTYAHSDWMHYLAEVGIVGCTLLLLITGTWFVAIVRRFRFWNGGHALWLATGFALIVYAAFEFILWSPSVYFIFACLPALVLKTLKA